MLYCKITCEIIHKKRTTLKGNLRLSETDTFAFYLKDFIFMFPDLFLATSVADQFDIFDSSCIDYLQMAFKHNIVDTSI